MSEKNRNNLDNNEFNNYNSNNEEYDEYLRQYEEQLRMFQSLDDDLYDEDTNFEFQQNTHQNGQRIRNQNPTNYKPSRPSGSRQPNYNGKPRKNTANKSKYQSNAVKRGEPLKFGSHNDDLRNNKTKKSRGTSNTQQNKGKKAVNEKMKNKKRRSPIKTFFKSILLILVIVIVIVQVLLFKYLGLVNYVDTGHREVTKASMDSKDVLNVLLIGSDSRSKDERGRTDSMILLSVNKRTKEFTMTSFMRDMYVEIPNNGKDKLNAAYVYGGAELLMDTIQNNFDIKIDKYVYIDFYSFVDIVDAVGGIKLDISDEEANGMKAPMAEQNKYLGNKKGTDYLTSGGKNKQVNGNQALAYARLRYVGNADFERTERQRIVISKVLEKAKTLNPIELDNFAKVCMTNLTTNMNKTELYFLTYRVPFIFKYENKQQRIPADDAYTYGTTPNGQSILDVDFEKSKQQLKDSIF